MIETRIRQALEADTGVAGIVGKKIRPVMSGAKDQIPYVIYSISGREPVTVDGWLRYTVELTCVAETYTAAVALAEAVLAVFPDDPILSYKSGAVLISSDGGSEVFAYRVDASIELIEESAVDGAAVFAYLTSGIVYTEVFGVTDIKIPLVAREAIPRETAGIYQQIGLGYYLPSEENPLQITLNYATSTPNFAALVAAKTEISCRVKVAGKTLTFPALMSEVEYTKAPNNKDEIKLIIHPQSEIGVA